MAIVEAMVVLALRNVVAPARQTDCQSVPTATHHIRRAERLARQRISLRHGREVCDIAHRRPHADSIRTLAA